MKRILLGIIIIICFAVPAFSQVRLDLGVSVPITVGALGNGGVVTDGEITDFLTSHILPFPEGDLYYQFDLGLIRVGAGVRVFTFILQSVLWPDIFAEVLLGPVVVQAHLGGLLFATFGLANGATVGSVLIPDLSAWFAFGKSGMFRVGAGVLGMMAPEVSEDYMLIIPYAGFRVVLLLGG